MGRKRRKRRHKKEDHVSKAGLEAGREILNQFATQKKKYKLVDRQYADAKAILDKMPSKKEYERWLKKTGSTPGSDVLLDKIGTAVNRLFANRGENITSIHLK